MTNNLTSAQAELLRSGARRKDHCIVASRGKTSGAAKSVSMLIDSGLAKEMKAKAGAPVWRSDATTGTAYSLKLTAAGLKQISAANAANQRCDALARAPSASESRGHASAVKPGGGAGKRTPSTQATRPAKMLTRATAFGKRAQGAESRSDQPPGTRMETVGVVSKMKARGRSSETIDAESSTAGRNRALPRPDSKLALLVDLLSRDRGSTLAELTAALTWLPHTTRAALTRLRQRGFAVERYKSEAESVSIFRIVSDRAGDQEAVA